MLLVEDHPDVRRGLERSLVGAGAEVLSVGSAEEASELLVQERVRPDLVISDVDLPGNSGVWLAGLVRQIAGATPIILITGGDLEDCRPADLLLRKPIEFEELARHARALLTTPR